MIGHFLREFASDHYTKICAAVGVISGAAALWRYRSRPHHEWRSNKVPVEDLKKLSFVPDKKEFFFGLAGEQKPQAKMTYNQKDFADYVCMLFLTWLSCGLAYGFQDKFTQLTVGASVFMIATFAIRHGVQWNGAPLLLGQPLKSVSHFLYYKFHNMRLGYFAQVSLCVGEAAVLSSGAIQNLEIYRTLQQSVIGAIGEKGIVSCAWFLTFGLFYVHLGLITVIRSLTFVAHVWDHKHVFAFLGETGWKKVLRFVPRDAGKQQDSVIQQLADFADHLLGLTHAFITGLWTHLVTVIPWYACLHLAQASATPSSNGPIDPACCLLMMVSWLLRFLLLEQHILRDFDDNELNDWYIRDHWLGHHDKFEFNYMHGPHHDALPVGMIAVADNGPLEGLVRHSLGHVDSFLCPPFAFWRWTKTVVRDIVGHQYVPGVFPWSFSVVDVGVHHVEHHYLSMHPLGNGIGCEQDPRNNCEVETWLSGDRYSPDNKLWNWFAGEVARLELKDSFVAKRLLGREEAGRILAKVKIPNEGAPDSKRD